jgi:hypothetical protein
MNPSKNIVLAMLILSLLMGCTRQELTTRQEVLSYLHQQESTLIQKNVINDMSLTLMYFPHQLAKNKNLIAQDGGSKSKQLYFLLSMSKDGHELLKQVNPEKYGELVQTLAFQMPHYIYAKIDGGQEVEAKDCLFQNTYGMSNANELLISFDAAPFKSARQAEFVIKEFGLQCGDLYYSFQMNDINAITKQIKF